MTLDNQRYNTPSKKNTPLCYCFQDEDLLKDIFNINYRKVFLLAMGIYRIQNHELFCTKTIRRVPTK